MGNVPNGVGVSTFTVADPGAVVAGDVAVTVTVAGMGTTAGDVYSPDALIVPFALPPVTAQVTFGLFEPFTVAVKSCWVAPTGHELPVSSAYIFTIAGLTVTTVPTISVSVGVAWVTIPSVP
jgi:hypothetical protein